MYKYKKNALAGLIQITMEFFVRQLYQQDGSSTTSEDIGGL